MPLPSKYASFAAAAVGLLLGGGTLSAADAPSGHAAVNAQFEQLTTVGHDFEGLKLKLPPPTLPDGLDAEGQKKAMATIADRNRPLADLLKPSAVAPFVLKLQKVEQVDGKPLPASTTDAPQRTLRQLDLWFVAYGDVLALSDEEQVKGVFDMKERERSDGLPVRSGTLTDAELASRKIEVTPAKDGADAKVRTNFSYSTFVLLDDVLISTTRRTTYSRLPASTILAAAQDPRFDKDAEFPNHWQPILRDAAGKVSAGAAQPFAGGAFYLKITPLVEPAGANFIELHQIFEEPFGWFQGGPKLSSKLGIVVQDEVRRFRKKLPAAK